MKTVDELLDTFPKDGPGLYLCEDYLPRIKAWIKSIQDDALDAAKGCVFARSPRSIEEAIPLMPIAWAIEALKK